MSLHSSPRTFDPLISVAICAGARDTPTQSEDVYWSTFSGVALAEHAEQHQKDGVGYIFAKLLGGKCDHHVVSVSCLAYDIVGTLTGEQVCDAVVAAGVEAVVYTTFNHLKTENVHKTRVIIPLAGSIPLREVGKDGYKAIYRAVGHSLLGDAYDTACCNPARLNYAPSHRPGSSGHFIRHYEAR